MLESKAVILKNFAGVDALPIAIQANRTGEMVDTILQLSPTFGAISMEDVVSPMCISATRRLEFALTIPIINNHMEGVAIGVDEWGRLLIETENGNIEAVAAGDVTLRKG